jgi:hypothetical protein
LRAASYTLPTCSWCFASGTPAEEATPTSCPPPGTKRCCRLLTQGSGALRLQLPAPAASRPADPKAPTSCGSFFAFLFCYRRGCARPRRPALDSCLAVPLPLPPPSHVQRWARALYSFAYVWNWPIAIPIRFTLACLPAARLQYLGLQYLVLQRLGQQCQCARAWRPQPPRRGPHWVASPCRRTSLFLSAFLFGSEALFAWQVRIAGGGRARAGRPLRPHGRRRLGRSPVVQPVCVHTRARARARVPSPLPSLLAVWLRLLLLRRRRAVWHVGLRPCTILGGHDPQRRLLSLHLPRLLPHLQRAYACACACARARVRAEASFVRACASAWLAPCASWPYHLSLAAMLPPCDPHANTPRTRTRSRSQLAVHMQPRSTIDKAEQVCPPPPPPPRGLAVLYVPTPLGCTARGGAPGGRASVRGAPPLVVLAGAAVEAPVCPRGGGAARAGGRGRGRGRAAAASSRGGGAAARAERRAGPAAAAAVGVLTARRPIRKLLPLPQVNRRALLKCAPGTRARPLLHLYRLVFIHRIW